jgi:hypothetical protein
MPIRSDDPLRKVTLNLYEEDCQWMEREYGRGWTERLRQHIHSEIVKRATQQFNRQTPTKLGDLPDA